VADSRTGSSSRLRLRDRHLVTPERLARARSRCASARRFGCPAHPWSNVGARTRRRKMSTTPFDTLRRSTKTIANCYTHTCTQCEAAPRLPLHCFFGSHYLSRMATRRIQAGRFRPSASIVSTGSPAELSRYGARHVRRLGRADLDSSGRIGSGHPKDADDLVCGHWCGRPQAPR
jgi:hypothetical protein